MLVPAIYRQNKCDLQANYRQITGKLWAHGVLSLLPCPKEQEGRRETAKCICKLDRNRHAGCEESGNQRVVQVVKTWKPARRASGEKHGNPRDAHTTHPPQLKFDTIQMLSVSFKVFEFPTPNTHSRPTSPTPKLRRSRRPFVI